MNNVVRTPHRDMKSPCHAASIWRGLTHPRSSSNHALSNKLVPSGAPARTGLSFGVARSGQTRGRSLRAPERIGKIETRKMPSSSCGAISPRTTACQCVGCSNHVNAPSAVVDGLPAKLDPVLLFEEAPARRECTLFIAISTKATGVEVYHQHRRRQQE